jgi:hypothetical protein
MPVIECLWKWWIEMAATAKLDFNDRPYIVIWETIAAAPWQVSLGSA